MAFPFIDGLTSVLKAAGAERLFMEQVSSVGIRPELEAAPDFVREGDVFTVTKMDRLFRQSGRHDTHFNKVDAM